MKKSYTFYIIFILTCFSLITCFSPLDHNGKGNAKLSLTLPGFSQGPMRSTSAGEKPTAFVLSHEVTFIGPDGQIITVTASHGETITESVVPGIWRIVVESTLSERVGILSAGTNVAIGTNDIVARGGQNNSVEIRLYITHFDFIQPFLASQSGGNEYNPVNLRLAMPLDNYNWRAIITGLQQDKFVSLDLSLCTRSTGLADTGIGLRSDGTFAPADEFSPGSPGEANVVSITLPEAATSIAAGTTTGATFRHFKSLKRVYTGNGIRTIGSAAFKDIATLEYVILGSSVTTIGDNAFENNSLASITIPNSVTTIRMGAFRSNNLLNTVTFQGNNTLFENSSFDNGNSLKSAYERPSPHGGAGTYTLAPGDTTWEKRRF